MRPLARSRLRRALVAAACVPLLFSAAGASAQTSNLGLVVRDGSIGPALGPGDDGVVEPGNGYSYDIQPELGKEMGKNLFHSFESFSIGSGESAGFSVNPGTENILSRVTGGDPSTLLGRLESEASLFLLNPFGVIFGQGATVDVNGAFYTSTADQVNFESGAPFLTRESTPPVSLSAASPASFGFLTDAPAKIELNGVRLCGSSLECVPDGERIAFVGGDITLRGREDLNEALEVPGGDIQFVSVAKSGVTVPLDASGLDVTEHADGFGLIRFTDSAVVDANNRGNFGTGRIVIRGGRFVMEGGGLNAVNRGDVDGRDTAVDIAVTDDVEIGESAAGRRTTFLLSQSGLGRTGDLHIEADEVKVKEATRFIAQTFDPSDGPSIYIDANSLDISGTGASQETEIYVRARNAEGGNSGDLYFSGRGDGTEDAMDEIDIRDGAQVYTTANDDSAAGNLELRANTFDLSNGGQVFSTIEEDATGGGITVVAGTATITGAGSQINSGANGTQTGAKIDVIANSLVVEDGGTIASSATDAGDGASIDVAATTVEVVGGGAIISENSGLGTGGAIGVHGEQSVALSDEGQISSTTSAAATLEPASRRGGNVTVTGGTLEITAGDGAVAVAQVSAVTTAEGKTGTDEGRGGDVLVDVDTLRLREGGQLRSVTENSAPAGSIQVFADTVEIDGVVNSGALPSGIFATSGSRVDPSATGAAGDVSVDTRILTITNGGEMVTETFGIGPAGDIDITASERVTVRGNAEQKSVIQSQGDDGDGGNLTITTDVFELLDGGEVSASTLDTADSGNVQVTARTALISGESVESRSGIFAQTNSGSLSAGDSGSIRLTVSERTVVTDRGIVSSKSRGGGTAGDVTLDGGGSVEVSNGGEISAVAEGFILPPETIAAPGDDPGTPSADIRIVDASDVLVTRGGTVTAQTRRNAPGGRIDVAAENIRVTDGGVITAESVSSSSDAGAAGQIDLAAKQSLDILGSEVTTETVAGEGGVIRLRAGDQITIGDETEISTRSTGPGNAGDIRVEDTGKLEIKEGSTMTAETTGAGGSGQIIFEKIDDVLVTGGSRITTKSSGEGSGDAGSIVIAANETFRLEDKSEITTTADDAGGGRISIQAGELVYLLDSKLETSVNGGDDVAEADAGDIDITFRGDEPTETEPTTPEFVVINRSTVRANAVATDAGNISIAGEEVLISNDSTIEARSETGIEGTIQISAPDSDVVSQVTPLSTAFVDPGDRMLPPCVARTERTGSFVIENRPPTQPSPDSPLSPGLGTGARTGAGAVFDAGDCPLPQEGT